MQQSWADDAAAAWRRLLRRAVRSRSRDSDLPLQQYDIVFVPKSAVAEVGSWVDLYITRIIPFNRGFSYSISKTIE